MKFLFYSAYKMVYVRTILFYMHVVELNQIMQVTVADACSILVCVHSFWLDYCTVLLHYCLVFFLKKTL